MANKFEQLAGMLDPKQAEKLNAGEGDLDNIVNSQDGQKVRSIMEKDADNLKRAVQTGDVATLKNTLDTLMSTEEGARLIGRINDMMK